MTGIFQYETGSPVPLYDNSNDRTFDRRRTGNANNDRWNILGDPRNLDVSLKGVPRLSADDPICQSVATTPELQEASHGQSTVSRKNGTILYPAPFGAFGNMGRNFFAGQGS